MYQISSLFEKPHQATFAYDAHNSTHINNDLATSQTAVIYMGQNAADVKKSLLGRIKEHILRGQREQWLSSRQRAVAPAPELPPRTPSEPAPRSTGSSGCHGHQRPHEPPQTGLRLSWGRRRLRRYCPWRKSLEEPASNRHVRTTVHSSCTEHTDI